MPVCDLCRGNFKPKKRRGRWDTEAMKGTCDACISDFSEPKESSEEVNTRRGMAQKFVLQLTVRICAFNDCWCGRCSSCRGERPPQTLRYVPFPKSKFKRDTRVSDRVDVRWLLAFISEEGRFGTRVDIDDVSIVPLGSTIVE